MFAFLLALFIPISLPLSIPGQTPKFLLFRFRALHLVLSPSLQRPYAIFSPSHQVPKVPTHQTAEQARSIFQPSGRSPFSFPSLLVHLRPHTRILPGYVNTGQQRIRSALRSSAPGMIVMPPASPSTTYSLPLDFAARLYRYPKQIALLHVPPSPRLSCRPRHPNPSHNHPQSQPC